MRTTRTCRGPNLAHFQPVRNDTLSPRTEPAWTGTTLVAEDARCLAFDARSLFLHGGDDLGGARHGEIFGMAGDGDRPVNRSARTMLTQGHAERIQIDRGGESPQ